MAFTAALSLDALRERIRAIEGNRVPQRRSPSGVGALDRLIEGLPQPGVVEISGLPGTGRLRVIAGVAALFACGGQPIAWVDPLRHLYPPALAAAGVDLERSLWVCPPPDRLSWALEQVVESGAFPLVVSVDPPVRAQTGRRWGLAAEKGGVTLMVTQLRPARDLPACVRLGIQGEQLVVLRDRQADPGASGALPPWPEAVEPW
jgi:recombination protein RecA